MATTREIIVRVAIPWSSFSKTATSEVSRRSGRFCRWPRCCHAALRTRTRIDAVGRCRCGAATSLLSTNCRWWNASRPGQSSCSSSDDIPRILGTVRRGSEAGARALRPRSAARMRGLDSGPASATLWKIRGTSPAALHLRLNAAQNSHSATMQERTAIKEFRPATLPEAKATQVFYFVVPGGGLEPPRRSRGCGF